MNTCTDNQFAPLSVEKARLYKTAYFSQFAHEFLPDQLPRDAVRLVFMRQELNHYHSRMESLFAVYRTMDNCSFIGAYYENALQNFVL